MTHAFNVIQYLYSLTYTRFSICPTFDKLIKMYTSAASHCWLVNCLSLSYCLMSCDSHHCASGYYVGYNKNNPLHRTKM